MKKVFNNNFYKDLYMDIFLPDKEEFYTVIHFHGGGLVEGDKGDTHQFCEHLTKLGFAVATANYSLMPKAHFPTFLYDAAQAVKYVMDNISKFGKCKGFIVSGQSAGAWMTLMLCLNKEYLSSVSIDNKQICGWISDSAQTTSHFNILKIERGLDPWLQRIDEAAPIYYVNKDTDFSRVLLTSYENDLPARLEQNRLLLSVVKNYRNDLDIELKVLKGNHCEGSSVLNENGEYEVIEVIKEWMK